MSLEFTETEIMICATARLMEDGKTYFIGFGMPQIAAMLAQKLYTPNIVIVYEYGVIGPRIPTPFEPLILGDSQSNFKAVAWKDMNHVFFQASLGLIDYGMLGALQVDEFGNLNSTFVGGDYFHPQGRFAGAGGANGIASFCWRTVVVMLQEKRRFVKRIDFITSPGYLDGSSQAREKAGLPAGTGPYRVVTPLAVFGFAEETHRMQLLALSPAMTARELLEHMQFEPEIPLKVETLAPPTEEELGWLREKIDPGRVVIGKGKVVRL